MKRILKRILPLLLAAVLLSGCGSRVQPSVDITGKYYYLPVHVEYGRGSSTTALHRFNVETGSLTPLCPDPLCSHGVGECMFSGLINHCADNDVIWFDSHNHDDDGEVVSICRYHVDSGKLDVLIRGRRCRQIGNICMDMCMVDITEVEDCDTGDIVTVIGRDGDEVITADELATKQGSINYEVTCDVAPRVPRVYE